MSQIVVQQRPADWDAVVAHKKRDAAFEDWRKRLSKGDRLPRGPYFAGKHPGRPASIRFDDAWMYSIPALPRSGMLFTANAIAKHQLWFGAKSPMVVKEPSNSNSNSNGQG